MPPKTSSQVLVDVIPSGGTNLNQSTIVRPIPRSCHQEKSVVSLARNRLWQSYTVQWAISSFSLNRMVFDPWLWLNMHCTRLWLRCRKVLQGMPWYVIDLSNDYHTSRYDGIAYRLHLLRTTHRRSFTAKLLRRNIWNFPFILLSFSDRLLINLSICIV